jgi:autotransporter-associated beta strand protein
MKTGLPSFAPANLLLYATLAAGSVAWPAPAADRTWTGGGGNNNWSTPANWGGAAPTAGDALFFGGSVRTAPFNDFPPGTIFNGITINNPAGLFTLQGGSISLAGDFTDLMPLVPQTNLLALSLTGTRTVHVVADGVLTLGGIVSGAGAGLTKTGGGQATLAAANTFGGSVNILGGTLAIAADANLGAAPAGPTPGKIAINSGALRATANLTLNANRGIVLGPGAGTGVGTFTVNSGATLTYGGVMANSGGGSGGLIKSGFGGLTIFGANTYTGPTVIQNGTLTLEFTQAGAPANNIIAPASALTLGGANAGLGAASFDALTMNGRNGGASSQTFNGTTVVVGPAVVRANSGASGTAQLALGALNNISGGIVTLVTPTATGGAGSITTTTPNLNGILGGWATVGNGGVFNNISMGTEWASVDAGGNIVPYTGYQVYQTAQILHNVASAPSNVRIDSVSSGDVIVDNPDAGTITDVNTINLSETRALSIVIGNGNTLRLGRFGSIFKSDNANNITWALGSGTTSGGNGVQDQGTLTAGGGPDTPGEIVFYMNNGSSQSQGSLNLEAKVTDNGSGAVTLVKAGPGSMKLRGHNTHSGGLILLQGRLQLAGSEIGTGNPDGAGTGPIHVYPGAYVFPSGAGDFGVTGVAIPNNFFIAGLGTQQEQVGAIRFGNGTRIAGDVILTGDSRLGGGNAATLPNTGISGKISGPFSLDLGALGTINTHLSLFNPANDWTGTTTLNARNTASANNFRNGASEVIPHGVGKGNVVMNGNTSTGTITWDLNGFNETINGLLSSGNLAGCVILNTVTTTTSTLTVGDYDQTASYGGSIQNGGGGAGVVALTKIGGGRQTLTGVNTYTGPTTVTGGTLAISGAGSIGSSQQILVSGGTLDVSELTGGFAYAFPVDVAGGTLVVRSTAAPGIASLSMADSRLRVTSLGATPLAVETSTFATGGQTNWIDIASIGNIEGYPAQFSIVKYAGAIGGPGFNFGLGAVPTASTVGYVSNNVDNSSIDVVLLDGPKSLTWTGSSGPAWDINNTVNWLAFGVTPSVYLDVDSVRFTDNATVTTINLTTAVQPGSVLVNNSLVDFTFSGVGRISGPASLTKEGAAALILDNSGTNDFFGSLTISGGTVQVGNQSTRGNLGAGAVVNNGALTFARSDALTVANPISGSGLLTQNGSAVLTLSGDSTFTGPAVVAQGTLRAGSARALGTVDGATTVTGGTTLDVNGQNLGAEPVTVSGSGVSGQGAIVNSGGDQLNALRAVTLAGDTTLGGIARWDIRQADGSATLLTAGAAHKITKTGPNQVSLVGLTAVDPAFGDIEIQQGTFSVQTTTVQLGDPGKTVTVLAGATLGLFNLNPSPLNKLIVLKDGAIVFHENGSSGISGPISVEGNALFNVANAGANPALTVSSDLGGAGGLTKIGAGPLVLAGPFNDYSGPTIVSNGTLFVNGSLLGTGPLTVHNGTLAGIGTIAAPVTIGPNGNLAPGEALAAIGSMEIESSVSLAGTCTIDVNKSLVFPHDLVGFVTHLTFGGTLRINVLGPALVGGDIFPIFGFITASGAFNRIEPASPGTGLAWDLSNLTVDGTVRVVTLAQPNFTETFITPDGIVMSGSNGAPGTPYYVLSSTNIALPVVNWTRVATNLFDASGQFRITNAVSSQIPQEFFFLQLP